MNKPNARRFKQFVLIQRAGRLTAPTVWLKKSPWLRLTQMFILERRYPSGSKLTFREELFA